MDYNKFTSDGISYIFYRVTQNSVTYLIFLGLSSKPTKIYCIYGFYDLVFL